MTKDLYRKQRAKKRKRAAALYAIKAYSDKFNTATLESIEAVFMKKYIDWDMQEAEKYTVEVPLHQTSLKRW
jgi:hypothetical protein